jgi:hypothetical protein
VQIEEEEKSTSVQAPNPWKLCTVTQVGNKLSASSIIATIFLNMIYLSCKKAAYLSLRLKLETFCPPWYHVLELKKRELSKKVSQTEKFIMERKIKACYPAYGYESVMIGMFNVYALSSLLTLQCGLLNGVDRDVTFNGAGGGAEGHSAAHTHMDMYDYCHKTLAFQFLVVSAAQSLTMDRHIGSFVVPPQSFGVGFGLLIICGLVTYDLGMVPLMRHYTHNPRGISILQRIGVSPFYRRWLLALSRDNAAR